MSQLIHINDHPKKKTAIVRAEYARRGRAIRPLLIQVKATYNLNYIQLAEQIGCGLTPYQVRTWMSGKGNPKYIKQYEEVMATCQELLDKVDIVPGVGPVTISPAGQTLNRPASHTRSPDLPTWAYVAIGAGIAVLMGGLFL